MENDYSSKIIVKSPVIDIAEDESSCQCGTYLKHWENTNKCSLGLCTALDCDSDYEGIFKVKIRNGSIFDNNTEYIAPLCKKHSQMEIPFKIKSHNPVVIIQEGKNCSKENPSFF